MSTYKAGLRWERREQPFTLEAYDRGHTLTLGSGQNLSASSAPEYKGDPSKANPEELLAASLASCHMLTFLALAAKKKFIVDRYEDQSEAKLAKNTNAKMAIVEVTLHPKVVFSGTAPSSEELKALHDLANEHCFIANSVNFTVNING